MCIIPHPTEVFNTGRAKTSYPLQPGLNAALAAVEPCQTAFAGFAEPVVQIHAGFLHGSADHIVADVTRTGKEIA